MADSWQVVLGIVIVTDFNLFVVDGFIVNVATTIANGLSSVVAALQNWPFDERLFQLGPQFVSSFWHGIQISTFQISFLQKENDSSLFNKA